MIGVDVVDITSFTRMLEGTAGERFVRRVFSSQELDQCRGPSGNMKVESLAARFAAKEAVIKASRGMLNIGDLDRIRIIQAHEGYLDAEVATIDGRICQFELSLSHDGGIAIAVALEKKH
jgi:phosphopantetheine--protein transferase-like protein